MLANAFKELGKLIKESFENGDHRSKTIDDLTSPGRYKRIGTGGGQRFGLDQVHVHGIKKQYAEYGDIKTGI